MEDSPTTSATPVSITDDRVDVTVTLTTDAFHASADTLWDAFNDLIPNTARREVEEKRHNKSLYNMKSDGYSRVDVLDGVSFDRLDGPITDGWIARDEITITARDPDSVHDAYTQLEEWFDTARDNDDIPSHLTLPPLKAFHATTATITAEDGWTVQTDPLKCDRESGHKCLVDIDRWTVAYKGAEIPDSSWEDGSPAKVLFDHRDAYTVVLAEEADEVLDEFLAQNRLIVVDEAGMHEDEP